MSYWVKMQKIYHPYHLVEPSPWPYIGACGAFFTTVGGVIYFHYSHSVVLILGFITLTFTMLV